jgi:AcrR family transcriptional regulator
MPKVVAEKQEWVKLGFKLFAEKGEEGIIVDKMSRMLNCNRSSFYWHFKSKAEFINDVIEYWVEIDTIRVIDLTNREGTAKQRLRKLVEVTFKKDQFMDIVFYLKRYARKRKSVQKIVDDIDHQRIQYTAALLTDLGISKEFALIKANVAYKYLIGYHELMRYKDQKPDYTKEVYTELKQFIPL